MENQNSTPPELSSVSSIVSSSKNESAELIKTILEFITKCLYPGIIIYLLVATAPTLKKIEISELVNNRLTSAKVGNAEFSFSQAENLGSETAQLNSKIAQLEMKISSFETLFENIENKNINYEKLKAVKNPNNEELKLYHNNSKFTVLVFHSTESRMAGQKITESLLQSGYQSSNTETNFSELRKIEPTPGVVYITYTEKGAELISDIQEKIEKLNLDVKIDKNSRAIPLRRGDVQIMVF